jgi:hypothetical protein
VATLGKKKKTLCIKSKLKKEKSVPACINRLRKYAPEAGELRFRL